MDDPQKTVLPENIPYSTSRYSKELETAEWWWNFKLAMILCGIILGLLAGKYLF